MLRLRAAEDNAGMWERFTERARKVVQLANQEAQRFNHEYIGTEHILLGLIGDESSAAMAVLGSFGSDAQQIRTRVEECVQSGYVHDSAKLPQTPRAKKVIEYSMDEARRFGHAYVGTEHILLGLLREEKGVASQVLKNAGLNIIDTRLRVTAILSEDRDELGDRRLLAPMPVSPDWGKQGAPPAKCPKCGQERIVRIVWQGASLPGRREADARDLRTRKAIIASGASSGPPWVCLACAPEWTDVDRLTLEDVSFQHEKEEAIRKADFVAAAKHRDEQVVLRQKLSAILSKLLKPQ